MTGAISLCSYYNPRRAVVPPMAPSVMKIFHPTQTTISFYENNRVPNLICTYPKIVKIAQKHVGKIWEYNKSELKYMTNEQKRNFTQLHFIPKEQCSDDQWCAHTISHFAEEAGWLKQHFRSVSEFISWAGNTYKPIKTNYVKNIKTDRAAREKEINAQKKNMHSGDFIIWKCDNYKVIVNGKEMVTDRSHIGIIESINPDGTITVIEGNANYDFDPAGKNERCIAKTKAERTNGAQSEGEFCEQNLRDGLIRKTYTVAELAAFGYSGYIDNSRRNGI